MLSDSDPRQNPEGWVRRKTAPPTRWPTPERPHDGQDRLDRHRPNHADDSPSLLRRADQVIDP